MTRKYGQEKLRQKKLRQKRRCCFRVAALVLTLSLGGSFPAVAGPAGRSTEQVKMVQPYLGDVNRLTVAEGASQLIVVIGNAEDPAKGNLTWYCRGEDQQLEPVLSVEAVSGMNGISSRKEEGDKKTPAGVYQFSMAFGLEENPGSVLPYHRIRKGDFYVDDEKSRYYNQLVNENEVNRDWISAEDLMTQAPQYNYGLVLDYNKEGVPGKGSAIFLHCPKSSNNTGTSGCISVPQEYMKQILCGVDADTRIVLVQRARDLEKYKKQE